MSWRNAAACWLLALLLGAVYWLDSRGDPARPLAREKAAATPAPEPAYALDVATIASVELERAGKRIRLARRGAGWEVEDPAGAAVSPGLLDALVAQLVDGAAGERVAVGPRDLGSFGLAKPSLAITATERGGRRVTLAIGDRDPTETAAYGRVAETGEVLLVGVNLLTYADLLFDAAR
jgi:hypothetical protein